MKRRFGLASVLVLLTLLTLAGTAAAQEPPPVKIPPLAPHLAIRPFFLVTEQRFTASETFDAIFGKTVQPFFGGGAQIAFSNGLYVDAAFSRFSGKGERAFVLDGEAFQLGIPLKATITPIEVSGGYRFGAEWSGRVIPYLGAGFGSYGYTESSDFDAAGEDVSDRANGYLIVGGAEFRVHPWAVVSADVQYTHIGGVLGNGGVSQQLSEDDLGGIAARFRIIIGR